MRISRYAEPPATRVFEGNRHAGQCVLIHGGAEKGHDVNLVFDLVAGDTQEGSCWSTPPKPNSGWNASTPHGKVVLQVSQ